MIVRVVAAAAYLCTIVAANWAIDTFQPVPVGFGQTAPAGVVFAGLAFTLRDLLHHLAGRGWALAAVGAGAAISFAVASPALAAASAAAFGVSELADMAVYTPLADRGRYPAALLLSNTVGAAVDSALFLWLAFGSLGFFAGQMLGKLYITVPFVAALILRKRAMRWAS